MLLNKVTAALLIVSPRELPDLVLKSEVVLDWVWQRPQKQRLSLIELLGRSTIHQCMSLRSSVCRQLVEAAHFDD
jgi:hypothetical protein